VTSHECSPAKVTVAIPTYNRAQLLRRSLESALAQDYPGVRILVLDNASTDATAEVVAKFANRRIDYVRNPVNIGLFGNFCRAVELNQSPYLVVFGDDDVMLPGFIQETASALDRHPAAGFAAVRTSYIDLTGSAVNPMGGRYLSDHIPAGLMRGTEFIRRILDGRKYILQLSGALLRAAAVAEHRNFEVTHSCYNLDINMFLRLASSWDVAFIDSELVLISDHPDQDSHRHFRADTGTGRLAVQAELTDAVAHLMRSELSEEPGFRRWLADRLLRVSAWRSELTAELLPELNLSWSEKMAAALRELEAVMPEAGDLILVDEATFGIDSLHGRRARPFLEAPGGGYGGFPVDDAQAIEALEAMRARGASRMVFGWPSLWWLEYFDGLAAHLDANYPQMLRTGRLAVYDLSRAGWKGAGA
jgi:glycosyltransferase involved in cell wall biosynthesis